MNNEGKTDTLTETSISSPDPRLRRTIQELVAAAIELGKAREDWTAMISRVSQVQADLHISKMDDFAVEYQGNWWLATRTRAGWDITPITALPEKDETKRVIENGTS